MVPRTSVARLLPRALSPLGALESLHSAGDTVCVELPRGVRAFVTRDPNHIRQMFLAPPHAVRVDNSRSMLRSSLGDSSLFIRDEAPHQRVRAAMVPAFKRNRLAGYAQALANAADEAFSALPAGEVVDLYPVVVNMAGAVFRDAIFGLTGPRRARSAELIRDTALLFGGPRPMVEDWRRALGLPLSRTVRRYRTQMDELVRDEIEARGGESQGRPDVLDTLLGARTEAGERLTPKEVLDQMVTLAFAGIETTTLSNLWALHWSNHEPRVRQAVRAELSANKSSEPTALAELPYLQNVAKEVLRKLPPVPLVLRKLSAPIEFANESVAVGDYVVANIWGAHHNPAVFEDPASFRPERFADDRRYGTHEYLPFGGGAHRCVGSFLAYFQLSVMVGTILSRWRLTPVSGPVQPHLHNLMVVPKGPVRFRVEPIN